MASVGNRPLPPLPWETSKKTPQSMGKRSLPPLPWETSKKTPGTGSLSKRDITTKQPSVLEKPKSVTTGPSLQSRSVRAETQVSQPKQPPTDRPQTQDAQTQLELSLAEDREHSRLNYEKNEPLYAELPDKTVKIKQMETSHIANNDTYVTMEAGPKPVKEMNTSHIVDNHNYSSLEEELQLGKQNQMKTSHIVDNHNYSSLEEELQLGKKMATSPTADNATHIPEEELQLGKKMATSPTAKDEAQLGFVAREQEKSRGEYKDENQYEEIPARSPSATDPSLNDVESQYDTADGKVETLDRKEQLYQEALSQTEGDSGAVEEDGEESQTTYL